MFCRRMVVIVNLKSKNYSIAVSDARFILSAVRTPIGLPEGVLREFTAPHLSSYTFREALQRAIVSFKDVQDVFLGCSDNKNYDEEIIRRTGLTKTAKIYSGSRCGTSSFKEALTFLERNNKGVCITGGMESMSHSLLSGSQDFSSLIKAKQKNVQKCLNSFSQNPEDLINYIEKDFKKYLKSVKNGVFWDEIIKIEFFKRGTQIFVIEDEIFRKKDSLSNSTSDKENIYYEFLPPPGDGAAALVISTEDYILQNQLNPLAKIIAFVNESENTSDYLTAHIISINKALNLSGIHCERIARWEIDCMVSDLVFNCINYFNLNSALVNKNGGLFCTGYPVGISGIRAICHLTHSLSAGEIGCAVICDLNRTVSTLLIHKLNTKKSKKPHLTLYTKKQCPLCQELEKELQPFEHQFSLHYINIEAEGNKKYEELYKYEIPVLFLDGRFLCKHRLNAELLSRRLLEYENSSCQ